MLPNKRGQQSRLASDLSMVYVWYIHCIYRVYPWYIMTVKHAIWVLSSSCPENPCRVHVLPIHPVLIASLKACKKMITETWTSICNSHTMHIHGVCHVYTRYVWYIVLKTNYDFLQLSRFNIILSSTMALVCSIEIHINTWKWNFDINCIYVVYARHIPPPYIYMEYTSSC